MCPDHDHAGPAIALVRRSVRERWPTSEQKRREVADEMYRLSLKRTVTVGSMAGPIEVENDRNQTAAARVYAQMVGMNQADDHHADKQEIDSARFALDAASALAAMSVADKEALIRRAGMGHLLDGPDTRTA